MPKGGFADSRGTFCIEVKVQLDNVGKSRKDDLAVLIFYPKHLRMSYAIQGTIVRTVGSPADDKCCFVSFCCRFSFVWPAASPPHPACRVHRPTSQARTTHPRCTNSSSSC